MLAPKTLRKPSNWQDFESLCKKLWGEIWSCPEIKKNGRSGQEQNGVDVYGKPHNEDMYFGIQCKGKDEYTHKQFSEDEIAREIEKAKFFRPPLQKLYLATTANKDAKIEEFVRLKNIENISNNFFEVHIFSWEDIVELIDENRQTHDWYMKNKGFKANKSVIVTFGGGGNEFSIFPKFKKTITTYIQKIVPPVNLYDHPFLGYLNQETSYSRIASIMSSPMSETYENLSYDCFNFHIFNNGSDPLEEFKLLFNIEGEIQDMDDTNKEYKGLAIMRSTQFNPDVEINTNKKAGVIIPENPILVGDDIYKSDYIYLKPFPKEYRITINWKLISKDFKDKGQLILNIKPKKEIVYNEILVEDPLKVGVTQSDLEDFIIKIQ